MEMDSDDGGKKGAPAWIVTFADLMSLLLTFFVLLLSFSNMEIVKFRTMAGSVRNALGLKSEFALSDIPTGSKLLPHEDPKEGQGQAVEEIVRDLRQILKENGMEKNGSAKITKQGVILQLKGDLLFESGQATIKPKALPILEGLARYISNTSRNVDVLGHTDNRPISTAVFPTNWELSAARAGRAVRYLAEKGVPAQRLRAIGHADTVGVASNATQVGRAANRRVEFVFVTRLREDDGEAEPAAGGSNSSSQGAPRE